MIRMMALGFLGLSVTGCFAATDNAPTAEEPAEAHTIPLYGRVFELGTGVASPRTMLDGVQVCAQGGTLCAASAAGSYKLDGLPPNSQQEVEFRKEGYVPALVELGLSEYWGKADAGLLTVGAARAFANAAGAPCEGDTGSVVVMVQDPGYGIMEALAGASVSVRAESAVRMVYANDAGGPDAARGTTSSAGWAAAFGVRRGPVTIETTVKAGGRRCGVWSEELSDLASPAEVQVRAGTVTVASVVCLGAGKRQTTAGSTETP